MQTNHKNYNASPVLMITGISLLLITSGCGKDETGGGLFGGGAGALIGAAVAPRNPLAGAAVGALVGGAVGSSAGRSSDRHRESREREQDERMHARRLAASQRELAQAEAESRALRQASTRWCLQCRHKSVILGARSCSQCGGQLIEELMCKSCNRTYPPEANYRHCPYCPGGMGLVGR